MSTTDPNQNEESLRQLLRQWEVKAELPPGFRSGVWQRIERSRRQGEFEIFGWLFHRLESTMLRPAVALAYVLILLATGSIVGWSQAQRDKGQLNEALGERYVRSINPYQRLR